MILVFDGNLGITPGGNTIHVHTYSKAYTTSISEVLHLATDIVAHTFLKIFNLINLQLFVSYTDDQSGVIYANTLMRVFEDIARKLETYLTMVESAYGKTVVTNDDCMY